MQKFKCYILDATYRIVKDKAIIQLFCRTIDGRKICLSDSNFEPYFYAIHKSEIKNEILQQRAEEDKNIFFVTKIEETSKNLFEKETSVLKIFTNLPAAVPVLKDKVKHLKDVAGVLEFDIPFAHRYLIDKELTPMTLVDVECGDDFSIETIRSGDKIFTNSKILAVDIETYFSLDDRKQDADKNPILMIALYGDNLKKILTWKEFTTNNKSIEFLKSESEMISRMCDLISEYSPDIITGYFSDGFDFPYLDIRAKKNNVQLNFGFNNSVLKVSGRSVTTAKINGIIHVDVFKFIKKVISRSMKTDVFTLDAVSEELLGERKQKVVIEKLPEAWDNNSEELEKFCEYNLQDSKLTFDLCVKILPNMIEFVRITCLPLFEINRMTFSQLVESYIIKKAKSANEIAPNKPSLREKEERMRKSVKGAFVFEPKPGLYKNIVVFDYRSLYPSIIASHNISPGAMNCACCQGKQVIKTDRGDFWFCDKKKGFLSRIIEHLILLRAEIKQKIKKGQKDAMVLASSEALKVLANSFYGYLGFYGARWYCKECAECVTAFGRQYIHKVIDAAENSGFQVLYSDTDSVFLLLDKKTKNNALEFVEKINKELPGVMELDYEGAYSAGIFVSSKANDSGAKKKYALVDEKGVMKIKGFETVRRNWSFIAKDVQKTVLEIVLKEHNPQKAASYLKTVISDLRKNLIPVDKVVIHTQLQREISSYKSIGPHVAAAQRMQAKGLTVEPGLMLKFIIVKGKGKIRDKVRLVDEVKQEDYDSDYYIKNQVIPSVERIFAVLGLTEESILSEKTQTGIDSFS